MYSKITKFLYLKKTCTLHSCTCKKDSSHSFSFLIKMVLSSPLNSKKTDGADCKDGHRGSNHAAGQTDHC